jgi:hypothetical protein
VQRPIAAVGNFDHQADNTVLHEIALSRQEGSRIAGPSSCELPVALRTNGVGCSGERKAPGEASREERKERTHHSGMTRHSHAIVGIIAAIARRIVHVPSVNNTTGVIVVLRVAIAVRLAILMSERRTHVTTRRTDVVLRGIVRASKTVSATPEHAMSRSRVLFRMTDAVGDTNSSRVVFAVVEAHLVGGGDSRI